MPGGLSVGCEDLAEAVLFRVRPKAHIFGHIHYGYGVDYRGPTAFVNASVCTEGYAADNPPIVVDI